MNARRMLANMAYTRSVFQDRVEEYLTGAIVEYYKARLARKNRLTRWVQHWESEVERLLTFSLRRALRHSIRGFKDRRKAYQEVEAYMREHDDDYRHDAEVEIRRDFALRKARIGLTREDQEAFWTLVREIVHDTIG